jgi:hypothetical protein
MSSVYKEVDKASSSTGPLLQVFNNYPPKLRAQVCVLQFLFRIPKRLYDPIGK